MTRFGYTGREHDPETGLLYYRARWYDPGQGRFVSEDPIGFGGGNNWYSYVGNDPANWIDPVGLFDRGKWKPPTGTRTKIGRGLGIGLALALAWEIWDSVNQSGPKPLPPPQATPTPVPTPQPAAGASGSGAKCPPRQGSHRETYFNKTVKPEDAVEEWEKFLGPGPYTNIHPRTGLPDPDRIVSADGKRRIRYGEHEMNSSLTKHHYHEETWTYDPVNNVMDVDNVVRRVPCK